jgi:hypothetical protein
VQTAPLIEERKKPSKGLIKAEVRLGAAEQA